MKIASVMTAAALAGVFLCGSAAPAEAKAASSARHKLKRHSATKASAKSRQTVHRKTRGAATDRMQFEVYGPFLPLETYDHPRPLCEPIDVVLEARVHEDDVDTPEPESAADDVPEVVPSALRRAARRFGSFLRPKSAHSTMRPEDVDLSELLSAGVQIPVEGVDSAALRDSFLQSRGRHRQHLAIDIGAPKGTPVLAAADGEIMRLSREKRGGISLYQKDASGKYLLFYCHLSRYAKRLREGDRVSKGDVIAHVGRTGHVIGGSHLHFSIIRLPENDDNWAAGVAVNPYLLFLAAVP